MNTELSTLIDSLHDTLHGQPWFGKPVYNILEEVHSTLVYTNPQVKGHSLIDLLYHMITWTSFTLKRIIKEQEQDMCSFEKLDWRVIDPQVHTWKSGLQIFRKNNDEIINLLHTKTDPWLEEKVDYRDYNFRYLLNGLIQHHIYHAGQVAYVNKLLHS